MSDNPRIILAGMWVLMWLRAIAAVMDSHTTVVLLVNLLGVLMCPVLAYAELRTGLVERRERLAKRGQR